MPSWVCGEQSCTVSPNQCDIYQFSRVLYLSGADVKLQVMVDGPGKMMLTDAFCRN